MESFWNASLLQPSVTILVGFAGYAVYQIGKRDKKRDAAKVILLEVQGAERKLKNLKKRLDEATLPHDTKILPSNGWLESRHIFINNLDADEWDEINEFYDVCGLIDQLIEHQNSFFWNDVEEMRANKQRVAADYTKNEIDDTIKGIKDGQPIPKAEDTLKNIANKIDAFNESFEKTTRTYSPERAVSDAIKYSNRISVNLSRSSTGIKLKNIAYKRRFRISNN